MELMVFAPIESLQSTYNSEISILDLSTSLVIRCVLRSIALTFFERVLANLSKDSLFFEIVRMARLISKMFVTWIWPLMMELSAVALNPPQDLANFAAHSSASV